MRPSFHPQTGKTHWHRNPFRDKDGKVRNRRTAEACDLGGELPIMLEDRSFAIWQSDGKVPPPDIGRLRNLKHRQLIMDCFGDISWVTSSNTKTGRAPKRGATGHESR
jgi:hypothetical protein